MIDSTAKKISIYIKKQVPDHPSSLEVLEYSVGMFLNVAAIITGTLLISSMTGNMVEVAIILISFSLLRQVSGGIHLKSGTSCAFVSISLFTLISFFQTDQANVYVMTWATLLILLVFAPSNFENQHNVPKKYYPLLKVASMLVVSSNFYFVSDTLAITFLVQGITLILGKGVRHYDSNVKA